MLINMKTSIARRGETLEAGRNYDMSDHEAGRLIACGYAVAADRPSSEPARTRGPDGDRGGLFEVKTRPGAPETRPAPRNRRTRAKG